VPLSTVNRIDILEAFKHLKSSQASFCAAISHADRDRPAWVEGLDDHAILHTSDLHQTRQAVSQHLRKLWYQPSDTLRYPGLIACSTNTLALLQAVNHRKAQFEQLMIRLRKDINAPGAKLNQLLSAALGDAHEDIHQVIEDVGMKGIHLNLCYRKFQQLPTTIDSVSWTWSLRSRSIKTLSVQQALTLARKKHTGTEVLHSMEAQLRLLDPEETLALVKPVQPVLKANLVFRDSEGRTVRKLITAHSPLFYEDTGQGLPRKKWPGYPDEDNIPPRLPRAQRFLAPSPYIKALNLYRYLNHSQTGF